jgi:CheY-like chemotaxis protein
MAAGMEDLTGARVNAWSVSEQSRQQISVGVVDDQRLFRESIAGMLAAESFISVVGVACNGLEAIELVRQFRPAVMLMDV